MAKPCPDCGSEKVVIRLGSSHRFCGQCDRILPEIEEVEPPKVGSMLKDLNEQRLLTVREVVAVKMQAALLSNPQWLVSMAGQAQSAGKLKPEGQIEYTLQASAAWACNAALMLASTLDKLAQAEVEQRKELLKGGN